MNAIRYGNYIDQDNNLFQDQHITGGKGGGADLCQSEHIYDQIVCKGGLQKAVWVQLVGQAAVTSQNSLSSILNSYEQERLVQICRICFLF